MRKKRLKNGLTLIQVPQNSKSITIMVCVKVGSNNETTKQAGLSHFLEHMIFEGTKKRSAREIAESIEKVGGEFNAMTSNERTCFYVKLPHEHAELGAEILHDIITNSTFELKAFDKEKKVVLEEINMVNDQPLHYQWILFEKSLFTKIPTKDPIYGNSKAVKASTKQMMKLYHDKYYVPNNMIVTTVGNHKKLKTIEKRFSQLKRKPVKALKIIKEPTQKKEKTVTENRKNVQSYAIIGYKTVPRAHKDSYALDVIKAILYKGLSGKVTEEIRLKRGLAYSAGAHHESMKDYGFFSIFFNTNKPSLNKCKELGLAVIANIGNTTQKELKEAKTFIAGHSQLKSEDPIRLAEDLVFWESVKDAKKANEYLKEIKKVDLKRLKSVATKYLNQNYTMIVVN
ncbi:insulinase family protein [Candidatus Woesearchaeota archaeon]|jgi:predicted Zn-dependent peptidase|nr:insulinase family protein [Candidatus Woesearchaeota archaeon]MBT3537266.1 insulinase family protein [Candidatus Woesearchaeota archaeon]MBT4698405.1 insulinase family protein [Candidatus Woesearchaeota archaeon]MBT4716582.1 insulinase family protein [Candidatus Woesearchaeota archaeon]MBT7106424.1 insulinase family protein [Candidatus Woesearchaeota archaeon]